MKKIILLLLFTTLSFSQNKEFSIIEIDSMINLIKPISEESGIIRNKKNRIIGGFSITDYNLNNSKKLKVIYSENIITQKSYSYDYYLEIYFRQNEPFYIILSITRNSKNEEAETIKFKLNKEEIENEKEIKNTFLINIKSKINNILSQISD